MRLLSLVFCSALVCAPSLVSAQEPRSPDMQKQQHPENNPKPKSSGDSSSDSGSSHLNQGDVPKEMPSEGADTSSKSGRSKKGKAKKQTSGSTGS
jgi:hypothetical protein